MYVVITINITKIHFKIESKNNLKYKTFITQEMLKKGFEGSINTIEKLSNYHPSGLIGKPQDVSQAVLFLLDPMNKFLNASTIKVSGGLNNRVHDPD